MSYCPLRVYHGPDDAPPEMRAIESAPGKKCVTLTVGDVLPLLKDAAVDGRTWLEDFSDDELTISTDLYEVLLAYQYYRRPGA